MLEYNSIYLTHSLLNWSSCFPSNSLSYGLFPPIRTIQIKCKSCSTLSTDNGFPFHTKAFFIIHKVTMIWLHNCVTWSHVCHLLTALIPPDRCLLFPHILANTQPRALVLIILPSTCIHKFCSFFKHKSQLKCGLLWDAPQLLDQSIMKLHKYSTNITLFTVYPLVSVFFHNMYCTTLYLLMYL